MPILPLVGRRGRAPGDRRGPKPRADRGVAVRKSPTADPSRSLRTWLECLERSIAQLPSEWREVYELTLQGLSREEAARHSGKSRRAVQ